MRRNPDSPTVFQSRDHREPVRCAKAQITMTYFITFACHGSHMHGSADGSVDRRHNLYGSRLVEPNPRRLATELNLMDQPPYEMDAPRREAVLDAIIDRGHQVDWHLLAIHVRSNHVHVIVEARDTPEFVMTQLKSAASRRLNILGFDHPARKRWARHGSTRRLFNDESVQGAIAYVIEGQGKPMALFEADRSRWSRL
jgi:REP element-mobilizing transposase RayT